MKTGVFLHDYFYRKHCGKPLHGLKDNSWSFLNVKEAVMCHPAIFQDLKKLGVECAELCKSLERAEMMKDSLIERQRIDLVLHTDGDPGTTELVANNENTAKAAFYNILRNLDFCEEIKALKLVLHPPKFSNELLDVWRKIVDYAEKKNVILALENCAYGEEGIRNLLDYKEQLPSDFLKFTYDVGHGNIGDDPLELMKMIINDITHIHWHDNDGTRDQHLGPGMGNVDFTALANYLAENASGDLTITLECDKPEVEDYELEHHKLKELFK